MRAAVLLVLAVVVLATIVFFSSGWLSRPGDPFDRAAAERDGRPIVEIDGDPWVEALSWNFADGPPIGEWGWGETHLVDGTLQLVDRSGDPAVYFIPLEHGRDFVLETEVQLVESVEGERAGAHLITRDGSYMVNESGMVVYAGSARAYLRHKVNLRDSEAFGDLGREVEHGAWYVLRLMVRNGVYSAHVDGKRVHTVEARRSFAHYGEPHLAVENGVGRFRYLKVFTPPGHAPAARDAGGWSPGQLAPDSHWPWWVKVMVWTLYAVIAVVCVYMIRHYAFTLNRLFGVQRHPYLDVDTAEWPHVTVVIPAHDEEPVIGEVLEALLAVDYPPERLRILPVNDRSKDRTGEIIEEYVRRYPNRITPFQRTAGTAGKAATLRHAMEEVEDDIVLVFDADYVPGKGLIKQLVAPFFDPEVGAVMGRVVPHNVGQNLLTRVLDLERAGGYQVDQQARMNLHLVPQYGGTVGGIRTEALRSAGGWRDDSLAEDTDATYRLLLTGWKVVYQNRSECYEQVPSTWKMRTRQLLRWSRGHNQVTRRYARSLLFNKHTGFFEKLDGFLLLNVYLLSPVVLLGWLLGIALWFLGVNKPGLIIILAVTTYSTLGNFAIFFEIAAAAYLDGSRERVRLLPFVLPAFLISLATVTRSALTGIFQGPPGKEVLWHKTEHNNRGRKWS